MQNNTVRSQALTSFTLKRSMMTQGVLLLGLSSALCLSVFSGGALAAGQAIKESRNVSGSERIYIENMRGNVVIETVKGNTFSVEGTLDEKADGFELSSREGRTKFVVQTPKMNGWSWDDSDEKQQQQGSQLTIKVPVGAHIEFKGVSSNVTISNVQGSSEIESVNGVITATALKQKVSLQTVNGTIVSRELDGRIKLTTVNGEIDDQGSKGELTLDAVNGDIDSKTKARTVTANVVNGDVALTLDGTEALEMNAVNGDLDATWLNQTAPKAEVSTVSGDAELIVSKALDASIEMTASAGGDLRNGLTAQSANKAKYGPMRDLNFVVGQGKGRIDMTTVSGDLELKYQP